MALGTSEKNSRLSPKNPRFFEKTELAHSANRSFISVVQTLKIDLFWISFSNSDF